MLEEKKARTLRAALFGLFVVIGVATSTWVTRTPALRDALQASTEQMGMILFGFSLGSMAGILSSNWLVDRLHARRAMVAGMAANLTGLALLAVGGGMASVTVVVLGFMLFGVGMGWADIAVNVEGGAIEKLQQRPLMTTLHGCFSLGAMLGAMLGTLMAWLQVPVMHHLLGVVVVGGVLTAPLVRRVENLSAVKAAVGGDGDAGDAGHGGFVLNAFKDPRVLLIGLFALGLALTEGAAHDWLPLLMVDGYQFSNAQGTLIYMLFTLGVTVARLGGQWLLQRFTRLALMRASAVLAGSGLLVVVFAQSPALGAIAVVLWGLGAALGFPLALSAAAEGQGNSAQRVGAVASLGYVAILVGPPALGFVGEVWGLRLAMLPVVAACCAALVLTWYFKPQPLKLRTIANKG
ncbi:MFS transporter [Comamonas sp.]|uniref:MFS transporter n=1 Tax=Comamonas sp. TaxID=34028 RepID=UPI002FCC25A8